MGTIRYKIISGDLPMTVELLEGEVVIDSNIHAIYEEGSFTGIPDGDYKLRYTDPYGCTAEEDLTFCFDCPDGFNSIIGGCVKYEQTSVTTPSAFLTITAKSSTSYTNFGSLLFSSWNYNGTGTYETLTDLYWKNDPALTTRGPLNRSGIWANMVTNNQDIGFVFCADILVTKTYYIGFGCDNWGKVKVNGEYILEQDRTALMNMVGRPTDTAVPHKYWFIYPVILYAGLNVIEVYGHNEASIAAVGIEIYNATANDLRNATSDADLGSTTRLDDNTKGQIIFRSKDLVGENLQLADNFGYIVPDGYALADCGTDPAYAFKRIYVECGEDYTTTTTPIPASTTTTTAPVLTKIFDFTSYDDLYFYMNDDEEFYFEFGDGVEGFAPGYLQYEYVDSADKSVKIYSKNSDWLPVSNSFRVCKVKGALDLTSITDMSGINFQIYLTSNPLLTSVTFAPVLSTIPTLGRINLYSSAITTLDLSMFTSLNAATYFNLYANSNLTSITLPSATGSFASFYAYNCDLGYIDFTGIPDALARNSSVIRLDSNLMTSAEVNHILVDLASLVSGEGVEGDYTGRMINIGGTNACPDYTSGGYNGWEAVDTLESKGITVFLATGCSEPTTTTTTT